MYGSREQQTYREVLLDSIHRWLPVGQNASHAFLVRDEATSLITSVSEESFSNDELRYLLSIGDGVICRLRWFGKR